MAVEDGATYGRSRTVRLRPPPDYSVMVLAPEGVTASAAVPVENTYCPCS
ncbi:MAG: hypothetical protein JWP39_3525, partial [Jatrophihabitans sp.]|nr:hypothetical protein [Jatrophihabitans sp.]